MRPFLFFKNSASSYISCSREMTFSKKLLIESAGLSHCSKYSQNDHHGYFQVHSHQSTRRDKILNRHLASQGLNGKAPYTFSSSDSAQNRIRGFLYLEDSERTLFSPDLLTGIFQRTIRWNQYVETGKCSESLHHEPISQEFYEWPPCEPVILSE